MSTPRPDPSQASREDLLAALSVDPQKGLSGREADRRRDTSQAKPLFATSDQPFSRCLLTVLREPVLWILLAVSLIALFFDRVPLGLVCLLLTVAHVVLCAVLLRRAERMKATMQKAYDAPLARVLRSGRMVRVGADAVVPGDILYLFRGDLVPADCRLLSTDRFSVSERELDATDRDRPAVILDKDADAIPGDDPARRLSPENMAFAGGVVESGFATAVVVSIGSYTHLGGLVGALRPSHGIRSSEAQRVTARLASASSLVLTILIIPLVIIGIVTLRDRYELLDIFLSAVSLAALGLCEHTVARYATLTAALRRDAATLRDADNTADICGDNDAERLSVMTDLLLLGTSALHDGEAFPEELWTVERGERHPPVRYRCDAPDADDRARHAVELLFVWHYGRAALPAAGAEDGTLEQTAEALLPTLCEWAEVDTEALLVRYRDIEPTRFGVRAVIATPEGNRRLNVRVSARIPEMLDADLMEAVCGFSALFISTVDPRSGEETLCAMLTHSPRTSPKTAGWIKGMEAAGIRVAALLSDVSEANTRILSACGLCDHHPAVRPASGTRRLAEIMSEGVRAFEGCSDREIEYCILDLQEEGRVVGVLSVEGRDAAHLNAADVALCCSPSVFADAENDFLRPMEENRITADGGVDALRANDLCRRRADVLVRRARPTGGGLGGVRTALLAADRMRTVLEAVSGYLFLANTMRLVCVLFAAVFGLLPIPAPLLLISGCFVDAAVLLSLRHIPADVTPAPRCVMSEALEKPWLRRKLELICLASTTLLPWLVALIARLAGAGIDKGMAGYAMLAMVAMQTAIYISLRPRRDPTGKRRTDRTYALTLLLLVLVYVGTLAAALGTGLHPLYALLVPPIPALLYIAAVSVVGKLIAGRRN